MLDDHGRQSFEITTTLPLTNCKLRIADVQAEFHRQYERIYFISDPDTPVEIVNLRVEIVSVPVNHPVTYSRGTAASTADRPSRRTVYLDGQLAEVDVYERDQLAVGTATMFRVFDCVIGALAQALPDRMPAAGSSQGAILLVSVPDSATGQTKVSVAQALCGGSGGRPTKDGTDGADTAMGFLRNIPTESIEIEMPILVTKYRLREGSAGSGRWRGGIGVELGFKVLRASHDQLARHRTLSVRPLGPHGG